MSYALTYLLERQRRFDAGLDRASYDVARRERLERARHQEHEKHVDGIVGCRGISERVKPFGKETVFVEGSTPEPVAEEHGCRDTSDDPRMKRGIRSACEENAYGDKVHHR